MREDTDYKIPWHVYIIPEYQISKIAEMFNNIDGYTCLGSTSIKPERFKLKGK